MTHRRFVTRCGPAAVILALSLTPVVVGGQSPLEGQVVTSSEGWTVPRTPDGQADIQGVWVNFDRTPLEVPRSEDAARLAAIETWYPGLEVTADGIRGIEGPLPGGLSRLLGEGTGEGNSSKRSPPRRSMVVDPPTGRVPVRAEAEATKNESLTRLTDTWENHTPWERCITRGVPGGMFHAGYNSAYRILQSRDYVVILYEMIHEPRVIPLDGGSHVAGNIRLWNGDSRGRWEGNTLVVEVTNYRQSRVGTISTSIATAPTLMGLPQSDAMRVVERFTRLDANTLQYEATIEDPGVYGHPWTVSMPLMKDDEYQMYEYACHEGNYGLPNALSGARAKERATTKR